MVLRRILSVIFSSTFSPYAQVLSTYEGLVARQTEPPYYE